MLETTHDEQGSVAPAGKVFRTPNQRGPYFSPVREPKPRRHNSHHGAGQTVYVHLRIDNVRSARKSVLPKCIAKEDHMILARLSFFRKETPSEGGANLKDVQQADRNLRSR